MSGRTVRIDDEAYSLLQIEKDKQPSLSLADIANIAIKEHFKTREDAVYNWLKTELVKALESERDAYKEEVSVLKDEVNSLKEALLHAREEVTRCEQTVTRERQLVDNLKQWMRANIPENVTELKQNDTDKENIVTRIKKRLRMT